MTRLRRCTIENVGLIARAEVDIGDGLTVFTGETGSGKTMLLDSLQLALGERASPDTIARGATVARVTLEVEADAGLRERFGADGFALDADEDAILSREIQRAGKSAARVNGRPATVAQLRAYGETLVDVVGQHEHQRLLSAAYQCDVLDRYGGDEALATRDRVAAAHARAAELDAALHAHEEHEGRALAEAEFARFAAGEIAAAQVSAAEEAELRERRAYLMNAERIAEALRGARDALGDGDGGASDGLGAAMARLAAVARYGGALEALSGRASTLQSDAMELAVAVTRELERTEFDAAGAEETGARLDLIERLKKKYGGTVSGVLAAGERFAALAEAYDARDEERSAMRAERDAAVGRLGADAAALTALRTAAARELGGRVRAELAMLGMKNARFEVTFEPLDEPGPRGRERVEFALAANRGEPLRPLARAASGGELSRVLLALVVVLADRREPTALVFDEIDAGIGGATADAVGERLSALARSAQVLCITHLAQIAAWADTHVALRKRETRGGTRIEATALDQGEIAEEVARMLSGSSAGVAREHADVLLREARAHKAPRLRSA